jgi:adenylate kinase family enzyme
MSSCRIAIVGNSGSGKTTLAGQVAARLDLERVELDALFHQPGWSPLDEQDFREQVAARLAGPRWVVDGNYSAVRDLVWGEADTLVWLDLPRCVVMPAITRRTLARIVFRKTLWNGNRESWRNIVDRRPEQNILLWAWTRDRPLREQLTAAVDSPAWQHLQLVRLRSRREVRQWLSDVEKLDYANARRRAEPNRSVRDRP